MDAYFTQQNILYALIALVVIIVIYTMFVKKSSFDPFYYDEFDGTQSMKYTPSSIVAIDKYQSVDDASFDVANYGLSAATPQAYEALDSYNLRFDTETASGKGLDTDTNMYDVIGAALPPVDIDTSMPAVYGMQYDVSAPVAPKPAPPVVPVSAPVAAAPVQIQPTVPAAPAAPVVQAAPVIVAAAPAAPAAAPVAAPTAAPVAAPTAAPVAAPVQPTVPPTKSPFLNFGNYAYSRFMGGYPY